MALNAISMLRQKAEKMIFDFRFMRLYKKIDPGEAGDYLVAVAEYIVAYRRVYLGRGRWENRPSEADRWLLIDLWLVQLKFRWTKVYHYADEEKREEAKIRDTAQRKV